MSLLTFQNLNKLISPANKLRQTPLRMLEMYNKTKKIVAKTKPDLSHRMRKLGHEDVLC